MFTITTLSKTKNNLLALTLLLAPLACCANDLVAGNITKVVIPAAGYGTRFMPFTKTVPKELLPILNKAGIEYVIEECLASDFNECCLIINEDKKAIQEYFSHDGAIEKKINAAGKSSLLSSVNNLIEKTAFTYINQVEMKGLGHAVLMGKPFVQQEFFGVVLPDNFFPESGLVMKKLADLAKEHNASVIAVQKVKPEEISAYGAIKIGATISDRLFKIVDVVEKPKSAAVAPSLYAIVGRYVFSPSIFDAIERIAPSATGEIQLTDAMVYLVNHGEKVLAYEIDGIFLDTGRPLGWLETNVYFCKHSAEYGNQIKFDK